MYLEVNQPIEKTISLIKERIEANTPFALSRYGDGEIYFLNRNSPIEHQIKNCKLWGYNHPLELNTFYNHSSEIILNGLKNSDVIGIMDKTNDIAKNINYKEEKVPIKKSFLKDNGVDTSNLIVCDHMLPEVKSLVNLKTLKISYKGKV